MSYHTVLLEVKAIDPDTDMDALVANVRDIDLVIWGSYNIYTAGYGVKKVQMMMDLPFNVSINRVFDAMTALPSIYSVDVLNAYVAH